MNTLRSVRKDPSIFRSLSGSFTLLVSFALCCISANSLAEGGPCFSGQPLPDCQSFVILEPGYGLRLNGPSEEKHYIVGDFGLMWNRNDRYALGGAVFVGALAGPTLHFRVGIRPRIRLWLSRENSIEGSLGPFIGPVTVSPPPEHDINSPYDWSKMRLGLSGQISFNIQDKFSWFLLAEALSADGRCQLNATTEMFRRFSTTPRTARAEAQRTRRRFLSRAATAYINAGITTKPISSTRNQSPQPVAK